MELEIRYAHHPDDVRGYDSASLRHHFLVGRVFVPGALKLIYTHVDRVIFGGIMPTVGALELVGGKELGTERFLDRRELGLINVGGPGRVILDGNPRTLGKGDGLYVGRGT
jgi:4-deoxy-L-threo-5-hexosulose-uronate ketol-isomerase